MLGGGWRKVEGQLAKSGGARRRAMDEGWIQGEELTMECPDKIGTVCVWKRGASGLRLGCVRNLLWNRL